VLADQALSPEKPHGRLNRPRPILAVFPFADANLKSKENGLGTAISAMLMTEMRNHSNFMMLERSKIAEALGDWEATPLGVTQKQIRLLETIYHAEVALTGDVAYWDGLVEVDARLISTRTGEVVAAVSGRSPRDKDLRKLVAEFSQVLEQKYLRQWMGNLIVACQPVDAEVYLNGEYTGKASVKNSLRMEDLLEGRYRLDLIAPGYRNWSDTVDLAPKSVVTVNASLSALPGNLIVNSEPVDADVYLDGKSVGKTPLEIKNVAEGEHRLKLELVNFYPSEEKVFVNSGQSTRSNATLRIRMGVMDITSNPVGASVSLNGRFFGKTPLFLDKVEPGQVTLEITAPSYRSFRDLYIVKPSDTIIIRESLKLRTGYLTVVSTPREVVVRIEEHGRIRKLGVTPVVKESLNVGEYKIWLEKENYYPNEKTFTVETDEETRLEVYLERKPGRLVVTSDPHTEILVNDAFAGHIPDSSMELTEGEYTVKLNSFRGSSEAKVSISANRETHLKKTFSKGKAYLSGIFLFFASLSLWIIP